MATRALQQVVTYLAWDTSANAYKTGDVANHTTSWVKDGTRSATTNAAAEVDSANCPGMYKVTLTATETDCIEGVLGGKSSTANIVLIPTMVAFDYLNTGAPATAGIPDVALTTAANNAVADAILARSMGNARTVKEALSFLRNKWTVANGVLTVFDTDDSTVLWTAAIGSDAAALPVVSSDPA